MILCVTKFVTSSLALLEAAIRVKSTHRKKSCLKTRKKEKKYENKRHFYIKRRLKDCFGMEFTTCSSELMPEEALTSFTICDAYIASLRVSHSY